VITPQTPDTTVPYTGNNQWTGATYDAAGNLTGQPERTYSYDGENRLVTATGPGGAVTYRYDGEGRRVKKELGSGTTVYVYDAQGRLAAEYGPEADTGTRYVTADQLGSTRLVTDSLGAVTSRYDYFPFGEEIPAVLGGRSGVVGYGSALTLRQRFTAKDRDAETGLDYFEARYLSSAQGRFTSPDPVKVTPERLRDPQQFNLYAYARNNPLRFIDPTGQVLQLAGDVNEAQKQLCELLA
jgi:RHS repeat-associated protein